MQILEWNIAQSSARSEHFQSLDYHILDYVFARK